MIIGVPFFAVIYAAIKSIIESKLRKKQLPTDTAQYTYVCAIDEKGIHTYTPESKQNAKVKTVYQFGQRFISDSEEQISGDFMSTAKAMPEKLSNKKKNVKQKEK